MATWHRREMEDRRVGVSIRAVRRRGHLRQRDVAIRAGISQQHVSLIERGHLDQVSVRTLRRLCDALEIGLALEARWRGGELARLLDLDHAAVVEGTARRLRGRGWHLDVEYTFSHFGERGSVDLLGWHPAREAILVIEVKSRLLDVQDTLANLDRKARLVPGLVARDRGLRCSSVGRLLVLGDGSANRAAVARHLELFASALPDRGATVRAWIQDPGAPLAGILFQSGTHHVSAKRDARSGGAAGTPDPRSIRRAPTPQRVRVPT